MIDNKKIVSSSTQDIIDVHCYRIIPFDIEYKITPKVGKRLFKLFAEKKNIKFSEAFEAFDEDKQRYNFQIDDDIKIVLFKEGIGLVIIKGSIYKYSISSQTHVNEILRERDEEHKSYIHCTNLLSQKIGEYIDLFEKGSSEKIRKLSSNGDLSKKRFSYVISFYFIKTDCNNVEQNEILKNDICDLLYTDNYTWKSSSNGKYRKRNTSNALDNKDILNDVHAYVSWANFIIVGNKLDEDQFNYFLELEIKIQRIWMFSYVIEKYIDDSLKRSNSIVSTKDLRILYENLIDMKLSAAEIESIVDSTRHEREFNLLSALKESSKIDLIIKSIENKSSILEKMMALRINEKRLKGDKNIELFLVILTILQVMSGFGVTWNEFIQNMYMILIVILVVFYYKLFKR